MLIKTIDEAIALFKQHAIIQCESTENGNYKLGNKSYDKIIRCISFIEKNNKLEMLFSFLDDENMYIRYWAACALLHTKEKEAIKVLKAIKRSKSGLISLNSEMTISEFKKGNI